MYSTMAQELDDHPVFRKTVHTLPFTATRDLSRNLFRPAAVEYREALVISFI